MNIFVCPKYSVIFLLVNSAAINMLIATAGAYICVLCSCSLQIINVQDLLRIKRRIGDEKIHRKIPQKTPLLMT